MTNRSVFCLTVRRLSLPNKFGNGASPRASTETVFRLLVDLPLMAFPLWCNKASFCEIFVNTSQFDKPFLQVI